jgi:polysaccharide export outer membrane protein
MKQILLIITGIALLVSSCTSQKELAYLNNLPEPDKEGTFPMDIPEYRIQTHDILYLNAKAMSANGTIIDLLSSGTSGSSGSQGESAGFYNGYDVNPEGDIIIPAVGTIKVAGLTMEESRRLIQTYIDKVFKNSTVICKLLSYKYTVIGEVKAPGTYVNYNNYLTVLEAIGHAGGVGDFGDRHKILVIRPVEKGTRTFTLNLQDKQILSSEGYFLLPNDVVIVQPLSQKIFNLNLPTITFIIASFTGVVSMTLLLINYFGN